MTTTLTAAPQTQDGHRSSQALDITSEQAHPYRAPSPPTEELDAFRGLIDGLLLILPLWLIVALLIAAL